MAWAWACRCCSRSFTVKAFDDSSAFTELGRVDSVTKPRGLVVAGGKVFVYQFSETAGSGYRRAKRYSSSLVHEQDFDHAYLGVNYDSPASFCANASGVVAMDATRSAAVNRNAVASFSSSGSLSWETSLDSVGGGQSLYAVAIDSSGNVFAVALETGSTVAYKFNSSGVKQWRTVIDPGGGSYAWCIVDSAGYLWVAFQAATDTTLKRVDTSGSVVQTKVLSGKYLWALCGDGSTGVWVQHAASSAIIGDTFERIDSSGTSVASFTDSALTGFPYGDMTTFPFTVDGSNNVYALVRISATWRVRKYNSSGTVQWTGGDMGWPDAGATMGQYPSGIQVASGVVYVSGPEVVL